MGIYKKFKDMDAYFKSTSHNKIILNDLDDFSVDDIEEVNNALMTVYDTDTISTVSRCECGELKGNYVKGVICNFCGTEVSDPMKNKDPDIWLKVIREDIKFINPEYWLMLKNILNKKIDYLRWLSDTSYNPPVTLHPFARGALDAIGGERSYVALVNNMESLLIYLMNNSKFSKGSHYNSLRILLDLWRSEKGVILSSYLPIVNKKLFVFEKTTKGKFTNLTVSDMIDLVMSWIKIANMTKLTDKKLSSAMSSTISKISEVFSKYIKTYIATKVGALRKHVYSARSHFTFRGVITSIPGRHNYDEIHIPWSIGVTAFRPHIINKLIKKGVVYKEASQMLYAAVNKYIPILDEILKELIAEAPNGKLYILEQRNPSLLQGSALLKYIGKFKTDPNDRTISTSPLTVKPMNADYDGDALNYTILLDNELAKEFMNFEAHYSIPSLDKIYSISGNLTLLTPATTIVSNYLYMRTEDIPQEDTITATMAKVKVST